MTRSRWHASPLAGTAVVMACLAVLAVPMWRLTGGTPAVTAPAVAAATAPGTVQAVVRVKCLDALARLEILGTDGALVLRLDAPAAGESEHDVAMPFDGHAVEWVVRADCGADETAVFITVLPDGREGQTRYLTGSDAVEETLRFEWPQT